MMDRSAEKVLNYPYNELTRFKLRLEYYPDENDAAPAKVDWVTNIRTLEDTQISYLKSVAAADLGASKFLPGEVFDEAGQHIARISYNGRMWGAEDFAPGKNPVADGDTYANRHGERWRELADEPLTILLAEELFRTHTKIAALGADPLEPGNAPAFYGEDRDLLRLPLKDGTEIVQGADGEVHATLDDAPVRVSVGDKMFLGLAYELEGAQAALNELQACQGGPVKARVVDDEGPGL